MRQLVGAFVAAVASRLMYHNIAGDAAALQHCRNGHFRRNEKGQGFGQGTLPMPWLTLPAFFSNGSLLRKRDTMFAQNEGRGSVQSTLPMPWLTLPDPSQLSGQRKNE
jgi:hypothetical protein